MESVELAAMPKAKSGERPTCYADRMGEWYVAQKSHHHRRGYGLYLTPVPAADFMGSRVRDSSDQLRILDPAAGAGILICAAVEAVLSRPAPPADIRVVAYELDQQLIPALKAVLDYLTEWCRSCFGVKLTTSIQAKDFVLAHAEALRLFGSLLPYRSHEECFDVVISNPPYFKISKNDSRSIAAASVVHGQPNIYGLFMAVGAALLKPHGDFIFIVPRSFASGPYFCRFRSVFFEMILPIHVHVFGSRRDTFTRDDVLQENIIFSGAKAERWYQTKRGTQLKLSSSHGVSDISTANQHEVPISTVLNLGSLNKVLRLPLNADDDAALAIVESWPNNLESFGLKISTGPVVPFRAKEVVDKDGEVPATHVPLLWMNHVQALEVKWPLNRHKREFIRRAGSASLLVPNRNYVLLRRFSAKEEARRLTAAPYIAAKFDVPEIGFENHLNYVYRPGGTLTEDEAWGLAALYNSRLLNTYFRAVNGNTQVSATELREMPLPAIDSITSLGQNVKALSGRMALLDDVVSMHVCYANLKDQEVG